MIAESYSNIDIQTPSFKEGTLAHPSDGPTLMVLPARRNRNYLLERRVVRRVDLQAMNEVQNHQAATEQCKMARGGLGGWATAAHSDCFANVIV